MTEPHRTCVGCRRARAKRTLIRLVRGEDGRARFDRAQQGAGRGAYVCASTACLRVALTKGRLGHAFRRPSEPPAEPAPVIPDVQG